MDSRASRELAGSKYNKRRAEDEEGVAFFQQFDAPIEALRDVDLDLFETHAFDLPETLRRRCRHVITENRRVQERDRALQAEDLEAFGALISAALESLSGDSEVRIAGLDHLVDTARATEGVCGARMTGAGFGSCAVCLTSDAALGRPGGCPSGTRSGSSARQPSTSWKKIWTLRSVGNDRVRRL